MPLPISSQTYIHNPLVGVQAARAGKEVGSPLSNFVDNLFGGFEKGVKIQQGLQEIEFAPREQARKDRAAALNEQRLTLDEAKEERLTNQQEWEQDFKAEELEIKRSDLRRKQDKTAADINKINATAALKSQQQAEQTLIEHAVTDAAVNGSLDSMAGIVTGEDTRRRAALVQELTTGGKGGKNRALSQRAVENIEDAVAGGKLTPKENIAFGSFLRTVEHAKNITPERELIEMQSKDWVNELGPLPAPGSELSWGKDKDGNVHIFELPKGKDARIKTDWHPLAIIPNDSEKKFKQLGVLSRFAGHMNKQARIERQIQESVRQVAQRQAQQQQLPDQQERPVKTSRAETAKLSIEQQRKRTAARKRIVELATEEGRQQAKRDKGMKNMRNQTIATAAGPILQPIVKPVLDAID